LYLYENYWMGAYNIKFPIEDNNVVNSFFELTKVVKDAYRSDLLLLILTQKGERYYEPDYGTNLLKFIFEPNDDITASDILEEMKRTVSTYIPTITIKNVVFMKAEDDASIAEGQLNVRISFVYNEDSFSEEGSIELNF